MINANSEYTFWRTYFVALVYIAFVAYVGISGAIHGLSNYYADSAISYSSASDADTAISLGPSNPNAYKARGLISFRNRDFSSAATDFELAIALRDSDYDLWLLLGNARSELGDKLAARGCYQRAVILAPRYSRPNYEMGIFLLKESQPELAFEFLSTAAEYDPELYPSLLDLARNTFPNNAEAIENSVKPKSKYAKKIMARSLIAHDQMTENLRLFLLSEELTEAERNELIGLLIAKKNFHLAREVWLKVRNIVSNGPDNLVFDGGFEMISASDPSGFGWQFDQEASALSVSLDQKDVYNGSRSLLLRFRGNVEIDRELVSQLIYLEPREEYELRFFARSTEFISASLPVILVKDHVTNKVLGRTQPFKSSTGQWKEIRTPFVTESSMAVSIALLRPSCKVDPCPVFGDLGLDDFSVSITSVIPKTNPETERSN